MKNNQTSTDTKRTLNTSKLAEHLLRAALVNQEEVAKLTAQLEEAVERMPNEIANTVKNGVVAEVKLQIEATSTTLKTEVTKELKTTTDEATKATSAYKGRNESRKRGREDTRLADHSNRSLNLMCRVSDSVGDCLQVSGRIVVETALYLHLGLAVIIISMAALILTKMSD